MKKIILFLFLFYSEIVTSDCQPQSDTYCGQNGYNCADCGMICCVDDVRENFAIDGCPKVYGCMSENMCKNEVISSKFFIWPFFR